MSLKKKGDNNIIPINTVNINSGLVPVMRRVNGSFFYLLHFYDNKRYVIYPIYPTRRIADSHLSNLYFLPLNIKTKRSTVEAISSKISKLNDLLYVIGVINELIPRIRKILNIFEPMMFPMAISLFLRNAATTEVTSSGNEVPADTIVIPINFSLAPRV